MNPWRKPVTSLAFVLLSAVIIAIIPFSSLAAPQGITGTPNFLPVVLNNGFPGTPTATATATATATGTATQTATPTLTPTPTPTPITPTIPITVGASGMHIFSPKTITITVGSPILWTWAQSGHTVTSGTFPNPDNQFCSPDNLDCPGLHTSNTGATFEHLFNAPGTYHYFCEIHGGEGMTGTVVVVQ